MCWAKGGLSARLLHVDVVLRRICDVEGSRATCFTTVNYTLRVGSPSLIEDGFLLLGNMALRVVSLRSNVDEFLRLG